ncbi:MAG TPA: SDR family oxidoreductase [Nitrospirota bacterium]|jgi:3-oxoacyl-[acyl-carrier protein] reductase
MTRNYKGKELLGLSGKTAVISGSTRGVGFAAAQALASAGANVVLNYIRNEGRALTALNTLTAAGASAILVKADVSDASGAVELISRAEAEFGQVDIIVNNAHGKIIRTPFVQSDWQTHQDHIDGILKAAFQLTHAAIGGMKDRGWGRVVNIGNDMIIDPVTGYSAYCSAMASLIGFTRNLAAEAGPWGVTVNLVSPGFVMTEEAPNTTEAVRSAITDAAPLKRLATPEDIAGAVVFFCSELGRFVTGASLPVNGGKAMF